MRRSIFGRPDVFAVTAEQSADWDRASREQEGVPDRVLMESAGRAVAAVVERLAPRGRVLAVVGAGHNGGDALVAARTLASWGRAVQWIAAGPKTPALDLLHGHPVARAPDASLEIELARADVVLDGVLGTGARGAPREPAAEVIRAINRAERQVFAVDLPSGLDGTTGHVSGVAVRAHVTITFGAMKIGLMLHPARAQCGRLMVVEIGFPPHRAAPLGQLITPHWAWRALPRRSPDAHKGKSGRLLLLVGSRGMAGAGAIAAHAAVRAGAGLVRIASHADNRETLQRLVPEATFFDRDGELPVEGVNALVVGCGMGTDDGALTALDRLLHAAPHVPALLDADALNLLARTPDRVIALAAARPLVLTPHVRELARISGMDEAGILNDPAGSANRFAAITGAVVLLKGQPSLVAQTAQPLLINTVGSSDLAAGGMGDQLSGTAGAFLAAGVPARDAAALGLFFGGRAADLARRGRALSPDDVTEHLPTAFAAPGRRRPLYPFVCFDQPVRR